MKYIERFKIFALASIENLGFYIWLKNVRVCYAKITSKILECQYGVLSSFLSDDNRYVIVNLKEDEQQQQQQI